MSEKLPLVSVICLCHNHKPYLSEAIDSVLNQTYKNIELIVVDDGSMDGSKEEIEQLIGDKKINFIAIKNAIGNCKAFNLGLNRSSGDYVIDLAADDTLLPQRIDEGLKTFSQKNIGVEFCNVLNVDENGIALEKHFSEGKTVPEGDMYSALIEKYIISPPGMMIKRKVLDDLNGYDENLSYEDFDFWVRSSRKYLYGYTNNILVKKRNLPDSLSKKQFSFLTPHQKSTLRVCQKVKALNQSKKEDLALRKRCYYEIRQCIRQGNVTLIPGFLRLTF